MPKISIDFAVEILRNVMKKEGYSDFVIYQLSSLFKEKLEDETSTDPLRVARSILLDGY